MNLSIPHCLDYFLVLNNTPCFSQPRGFHLLTTAGDGQRFCPNLTSCMRSGDRPCSITPVTPLPREAMDQHHCPHPRNHCLILRTISTIGFYAGRPSAVGTERNTRHSRRILTPQHHFYHDLTFRAQTDILNSRLPRSHSTTKTQQLS
jgi:hypothetical protein